MSRSYKQPYLTIRSPGNPKQKANKAVRKADVSDGKAYRKAYNSYNIMDTSFHAPTLPKAYRK